MSNLYTHKDSNIRKTIFLFVFFLGVVIGIGWVFTNIYDSSVILWIAVIFAIFMSFTSYWFSDKIVLKMTRAREASKNSNRELYNIVENLSITAGLPMPRVYIIDDPAPNAFATGRDPKHAVVAVTTGLLALLDRSELEGVVAHELAHIGNRDMLISTVAVVLVGFVAILSDIFLRSVFFQAFIGGRGNRNQSPIFLIFGIVLAILAPIGAMLIQLAISRKREFLADASGALLTRYPDGLASALEKISTHPAPVRSARNATAHLWIDDPFKGKTKTSWWHKMFMTHPPAEERIRALRGKK